MKKIDIWNDIVIKKKSYVNGMTS